MHFEKPFASKDRNSRITFDFFVHFYVYLFKLETLNVSNLSFVYIYIFGFYFWEKIHKFLVFVIIFF